MSLNKDLKDLLRKEGQINENEFWITAIAIMVPLFLLPLAFFLIKNPAKMISAEYVGLYNFLIVVSFIVLIPMSISLIIEKTIFKKTIKLSSLEDLANKFKINLGLKVGDSLVYVNGFLFEESYSKFKIEKYQHGTLLLKNEKETREVSLYKILGHYQSC